MQANNVQTFPWDSQHKFQLLKTLSNSYTIAH